MEPGDSVVQLGPWGDNSSGVKWGFQIPEGGSIREIEIHSGAVIDAFVFTLNDQNGRTSKVTIGRLPSRNIATVTLDTSREHITGLSGLYAHWRGVLYVIELTFHTNLRSYGPFGHEEGLVNMENVTPFEAKMENTSVVGFHGGLNQFMVAVGTFVKPTN